MDKSESKIISSLLLTQLSLHPLHNSITIAVRTVSSISSPFHSFMNGFNRKMQSKSILFENRKKILSSGVNFINVFRTLFSYECRFGSFFSMYVQHLYEKSVRKMLMKLTADYFLCASL